MHSFEAVYARMLFAANVRTQTELANILGMKQASISDAKRRGCIPADWCMRLYDSHGVRVDWQRFGKGPVYDDTKLKELDRYRRGEWDAKSESAFGVLREPDTSFLLGTEKERPVHSTVQMPDGSFPERGREAFPAAFFKAGDKVFRLMDTTMSPVLNKGALVAVSQGDQVASGDIVAVFEGRELRFRRAIRQEGGWELRTEVSQAPHWFVPDAEWPMLYYGKALWAFQPL